jgi:hypothetical protein
MPAGARNALDIASLRHGMCVPGRVESPVSGNDGIRAAVDSPRRLAPIGEAMPFPPSSRRARTGDPVQASRMSLAGPTSITAVSLIVFVVFWATTRPLMAVVMALTALAIGAFLLTLVFRTGRPSERTRSRRLWRYR